MKITHQPPQTRVKSGALSQISAVLDSSDKTFKTAKERRVPLTDLLGAEWTANGQTPMPEPDWADALETHPPSPKPGCNHNSRMHRPTAQKASAPKGSTVERYAPDTKCDDNFQSYPSILATACPAPTLKIAMDFVHYELERNRRGANGCEPDSNEANNLAPIARV